MKKIAYVSTYDASDVSNWSGITYYMSRSFEANRMPVERLGPLTEHRSSLYKVKQAVYLAVLRKRHLRDREPAILKHYAQEIAGKLKHADADIVFSPGTIPISYLQCHQPIVFWTDATFAGMVDFYPDFSNLSDESVRNGNLMEQSALGRCRLAIYSSEWAAKTALDNYEVESSKIKVVPFGANIEDDRTWKDVERMIDSRPSGSCRLLFIGVDWIRKGGDVALEMAKQLNEVGLRTELNVVGCTPVLNEPIPDFLNVAGFIDKGTATGRKRLSELIAQSHFLVLPTKADCTPMVLSEANSFGVPCLTSDVGGIASVVKNNINGWVFSVAAEPAEYCDYVLELIQDCSQYRQLALSSFNEYRHRLNWGVATNDVVKLLEQYCA